MQIPQALPPRALDLSTDDAGALAAAQPERGREYVQIARGDFRAALRERLYGDVGLLHERWSCALRVRCERPRSYVAFASLRSDAPAIWCGVAVGTDAMLEMDHEWELTSGGASDAVAFAVESGRLLRTEAALARGDVESPRMGNRALHGPGSAAAADALRSQVGKALGAGLLLPEARQALESDLAYLAARLRAWGGARAKPESSLRRRRAVRQVEELFAAHPFALPSIAELCELARVSERTLEYAFREQIGVPPARYLRWRRLNGVRRELRSGDPKTLSITEVAMRWGFWELGRFAAEYRALFGERPSATLATRAAARLRSPRA